MAAQGNLRDHIGGLKQNQQTGHHTYTRTETYVVDWHVDSAGDPNPDIRAGRADDEFYVYANTVGLPYIGEKRTVWVDPDVPDATRDIDIYCVSWSATLVNVEASAYVWEFTFEWTSDFAAIMVYDNAGTNDVRPMIVDPANSPYDDPTQLAPIVNVSWDQKFEDLVDARFGRLFLTSNADTPPQNPALPDDPNDPRNLQVPAWLQGYRGKMCNSAGTPKEFKVERSTGELAVTVNVLNWFDYDDQRYTVNNQIQRIWDGQGYNRLFDPGQLLFIRTLMAGTFWFRARKYYRQTFQFRIDIGRLHREWMLDQGITRRVHTSTYAEGKGSDGQYLLSDIEDLLPPDSTADYVLQPIVDKQKKDGKTQNVAAGDPKPFNGNGTELPFKGINGTTIPENDRVMLDFQKYDGAEWSFPFPDPPP